MELNRIGLVVNPVAGNGYVKNIDAAREVVAIVEPRTVITGRGLYGSDAVSDATIVYFPEDRGKEHTRRVVIEAAKNRVDAIIAIGGDGTMADVALALWEQQYDCPILGIGVGSINAGKLVTVNRSQINSLDPTRFMKRKLHGFSVTINHHLLSLALHDVVFSNTIIGTNDEKQVCTLDATCYLEGVRAEVKSKSIGNSRASVSKISSESTVTVSKGKRTGCVVIGFSDPASFFAKAIVGGAQLTGIAGLPAGCLVSNQPLVIPRLTPNELDLLEPIKSSYVSLAFEDKIHATGLAAPAVVSADGNPIKGLTTKDSVFISLNRDIATSIFMT